MLDRSSPQTVLPRKDWLLVPILVASTLVALFVISEAIARAIWVEQLLDSCAVLDPAFGVRHKPNCASSVKLAEGPSVEYRYNDCGSRSAAPCQPRPNNTYRIALLGASVSQGFGIPYNETFAARSAKGLSLVLDKPVEAQNFGSVGLFIADVRQQIDPALALQPDLAVLLMSAVDIRTIDRANLTTVVGPPPPKTGPPTDAPPPLFSLLAFKKMADNSRAITVAKHFLYLNRVSLLRLYRLQGDKTDHLHLQSAPLWKARLDKLEVLLSQMSSRLRDHGVPLVIVFVPSRPQVAILSSGSKFPEIDPWQFSSELRACAARAGVAYIDTLPEFARTPRAEDLFYVSDGHPNGMGNELLADIFVNEMKHRGLPNVPNTDRQTSQDTRQPAAEAKL